MSSDPTGGSGTPASASSAGAAGPPGKTADGTRAETADATPGEAADGTPAATTPAAQWVKRIVVLFIVVAALAGFPGYWLLTTARSHSAPCSFPDRPAQAKNARLPRLPRTFKPARLVLVRGQSTTLAFNRAEENRTLTIEYSISGSIPGADAGSGKVARLRAGDSLAFVRDDQEELPSGRVQVAAWVHGNHVFLKVCVQRSGPTLADPGSYQGTVSITDPRVDLVDRQVTVTLAYPYWQWIMELLVGAVLAGLWYTWVLQAKSANDNALGWSLVEFGGSMLGALAAGAGIVAAFGVYTATYLNNPTWGSSSAQVFALLGAMFSAFLAGAATVHVGAKAGQAASTKGSAANKARQDKAERDKTASQVSSAGPGASVGQGGNDA